MWKLRVFSLARVDHAGAAPGSQATRLGWQKPVAPLPLKALRGAGSDQG